ncbi:MAG: phosphoenolpyruvate--protein phosphotransferase [Brooklawnia sp.]
MDFIGIGVADGIATGPAFLYVPFEPDIKRSTVSAEQAATDYERFVEVRGQARQQLLDIIDTMTEQDPGKRKIFDAHIEILFDEAVNETIEQLVHEENFAVDYAIERAYSEYAGVLARSKNALIRERAADLKDVARRLLRTWYGIEDNSLDTVAEPVILVANDLFPSDTAMLDPEKIHGIVTEIGGATSHSAILAKSMGIPAVLGVDQIMNQLAPGQTLVVDGNRGVVHTEVSADRLAEFEVEAREHAVKRAETAKYLFAEPITQDGTPIEVHLNVGSDTAKEIEVASATDGVGLLRTEFIYMRYDHLPTEDEQYEAYAKVMKLYGERPVILRTLDIGGDKQLPSLELPVEQNPFLGLRALRLSFDMLPIFKTQLRAALRAGVHGNLWLMFPMVGSLGDFRFAKQVVREVEIELRAEGVEFTQDYKLGIMIEIPSIAVMADVVAAEVDFASIGTNDLCQYLTAVDRLNPKVARYYQSYHPAMFRMIANVITEFNKLGKPISICGELGGEPPAVAVLIGLGMRKFSMNASSLAAVKKTIRDLDVNRAERMANTVLGLATAGQVADFLSSETSDGLGHQ